MPILVQLMHGIMWVQVLALLPLLGGASASAAISNVDSLDLEECINDDGNTYPLADHQKQHHADEQQHQRHLVSIPNDNTGRSYAPFCPDGRHINIRQLMQCYPGECFSDVYQMCFPLQSWVCDHVHVTHADRMQPMSASGYVMQQRNSDVECSFYTNGDTCVNDCNEQSWNTLHKFKVDCCAQHHMYTGAGGYKDCMNLTDPPTESPTRSPPLSPGDCPFYSNGDSCVNDCKNFFWQRAHQTIKDCCSTHHSYSGVGGYTDCMGIKYGDNGLTEAARDIDITISPSLSQENCPFYSDGKTCVNDCNEEAWQKTHLTVDDCCSAHHSYGGVGGYTDCMGITYSPTDLPTASPSDTPTLAPLYPSATPSASPTVAPSASPTSAVTTDVPTLSPSANPIPLPTKSPAPCEYYSDGKTCVNDCNEESWQRTHLTIMECCSAHHSYPGPGGYNDCMGITPAPTDMPTESPSYNPTLSPSAKPSASPTVAPSASPTSFATTSPVNCLFYTDGDTCVNDCNEESWQRTHLTIMECCSAHHSYPGPGGYNDCMGITPAPTDMPTESPSYNPTLSPSAKPSASPTVAPSASPTSFATTSPVNCLFYTDGDTCVNDCNEESWQRTHLTIMECCSAHHSYLGSGGFDDCMGITLAPTDMPTESPSANPTSPGTLDPTAPPTSRALCPYYFSWASYTCTNDCNDGGLGQVYESMDECCREAYPWKNDYNKCMGITETPSSSPTTMPSEPPSEPNPTAQPTDQPTSSPNQCLYYNHWSGTCKNDCQSTGFYDTLQECCEFHYNWPGILEDCLGVTLSPTDFPTISPTTISPSSTFPPTQHPVLTLKPSPTDAPTITPAPSSEEPTSIMVESSVPIELFFNNVPDGHVFSRSVRESVLSFIKERLHESLKDDDDITVVEVRHGEISVRRKHRRQLRVRQYERLLKRTMQILVVLKVSPGQAMVRRLESDLSDRINQALELHLSDLELFVQSLDGVFKDPDITLRPYRTNATAEDPAGYIDRVQSKEEEPSRQYWWVWLLVAIGMVLFLCCWCLCLCRFRRSMKVIKDIESDEVLVKRTPAAVYMENQRRTSKDDPIMTEKKLWGPQTSQKPKKRLKKKDRTKNKDPDYQKKYKKKKSREREGRARTVNVKVQQTDGKHEHKEMRRRSDRHRMGVSDRYERDSRVEQQVDLPRRSRSIDPDGIDDANISARKVEIDYALEDLPEKRKQLEPDEPNKATKSPTMEPSEHNQSVGKARRGEEPAGQGWKDTLQERSEQSSYGNVQCSISTKPPAQNAQAAVLQAQNSNLLPPFVDPSFGAVDEVDSMFTPFSEIPTDFDRRKGGGVISFDQSNRSQRP